MLLSESLIYQQQPEVSEKQIPFFFSFFNLQRRNTSSIVAVISDKQTKKKHY